MSQGTMGIGPIMPVRKIKCRRLHFDCHAPFAKGQCDLDLHDGTLHHCASCDLDWEECGEPHIAGGCGGLCTKTQAMMMDTIAINVTAIMRLSKYDPFAAETIINL